MVLNGILVGLGAQWGLLGFGDFFLAKMVIEWDLTQFNLIEVRFKLDLT